MAIKIHLDDILKERNMTSKEFHILVCIGFLLGIPIAYAFVKVGYSDTIENYGMMLSPVLTEIGRASCRERV